MSIIIQIRRLLNWLLVILLIFFGTVVTITILPTGILLVIAGILISPLVSDLVKKHLQMSLSYREKSIITLLGIVIPITSVVQSDDGQQLGFLIASTFLSRESDGKFETFLKMQQEYERSAIKNRAFLTIHKEKLLQLENLFKNSDYLELVAQGTPYVELDTTIRRLVESAKEHLEQEQVNQALSQAPSLIKAGKFVEAYALVSKLEKIVKKGLEANRLEETSSVESATTEFSPIVISSLGIVDVRSLLSQKEQLIKQTQELIEEGKFKDAYYFASKIPEIPQLDEFARLAKTKWDEKVARLRTIKELIELTKRKREEEFNKLQALYEKGKYETLIAMGTSNADFDCGIGWLVNAANNAQLRKQELERAKRTLKEVDKLLREHQFQKAYEMAKGFNEAELQELAQQAKAELDRATEKKILSKLQKLSPYQIEQHEEEYAKLAAIFPQNEEYRSKLEYYRKRLTHERKVDVVITQDEYGEKWPFTIAQAKLDCTPPGIVTLSTHEKTYAVNDLASSQGNYDNLDEILKDGPEIDTNSILDKGLSLCKLNKIEN